MNTEQFIQTLASDLRTDTRQAPPFGLRLFLMVATASLPSALVIWFGLPRSPHLMHGPTATIEYTVAAALALAAGALWAATSLSRPEVRPRHRWMALPILVLVVGIAIELARTPPALWEHRLLGDSPFGCFALVSLLSLPILAGVLFVLRSGAPSYPRSSGAMAGLLAGGIAATLYTLHCPEDSLLFVGVWHVAAILLVASIGAVAGSRLLRW
jgi:hypothetical protein